MKTQVKKEKDILKKATSVIAEEFGIDQKALKLSYKQKNGIFFTFQFTPKEKAMLNANKTKYCVTINVSGIPIDLYKN